MSASGPPGLFVPVLTGDPADDGSAISAGTGVALSGLPSAVTVNQPVGGATASSLLVTDSSGHLQSGSPVARVATLTGSAGDDTYAISAGTGQKLSVGGTGTGSVLQATVATVIPVPLTSPGVYSGLPTGAVDSVTVTNGMVLLLTAESSGVNNGLWVVNGSGAWTRPTGYAVGGQAAGVVVYVQQGGNLVGTTWGQTTAGAVVGTNATTWKETTHTVSDRGVASAFSVYYTGDTVIVAPNLRVRITKPAQADSQAFISAANYVVLQRLQTFNPLDFGAVWNGSTDDTTAIQAAINAASNASVLSSASEIVTSSVGKGGIVECPAGIGRFSATLDLPSNVWLRGQGGASTSCLQLLPNSNCHLVRTHMSSNTSTNSNAFWCKISDLMLDGRRDNQGTILTDCTLVPFTTAVTATAGIFPANGTYVSGVGIDAGTTISSGGGTGSIVLSQAATIAALQQAPGSSTVYCGGARDNSSNPVPWCGIYHETNPYNTGAAADNQFDPSHVISDVRIYFVQGDGIRIHGRSDVTIRRAKVSFATGNGITADFDTAISECIIEKADANGFECPGHSAVRITGCKVYNSYNHALKYTTFGNEHTCAGNALEQNNGDGLHVDSITGGLHFAGTIANSGWVNVIGAMPALTTAWAGTTAYKNWRTSGSGGAAALAPGNGFVYACYVAGTSGGSPPSWPTTAGQTVVDGGVTWVCVGTSLPAAVGLKTTVGCVIDATCSGCLNALRVTGTSTGNSVRLGAITIPTNGATLSADSVALTGNAVTINGVSLTSKIANQADVSLSSVLSGQVLTWNGLAWANATPTTGLISQVQVAEANQALRTILDFVSGTGITITPTDDSANDRTKLSIAATGTSDALTQMPGLVWSPLVGAVPQGNASAPGANVACFVRATVPKTGTLHDLTYWVGTSNGNVILMIYDTGDALASSYSKLWDSGSTAVGTVNLYQSIDPALSVTIGQQIMLGIVFDGGTATFGRGPTTVRANASQLPASFLPAAGGALAKVFGTRTFTTFAAPSTISEANMLSSGTVPMLIARVA